MRRICLVALALTAYCGYGQGTLQFDQQVNPTTAPGGFFNIAPDPTGQSFIPTLSSVGFVQFYFDDASFNGIGSTISVNLWSGSIGIGTLLGTSETISTPDVFNGAATFLFTAPVTVTPGTTYYLQPFIQSEDPSQLGVVGNNYPNGAGYLHGVQQAGDFWFREGIVVPEPSIFSLSLLGAAGLCAVWRNRRNFVLRSGPSFLRK
jgi:hypothetical protein